MGEAGAGSLPGGTGESDAGNTNATPTDAASLGKPSTRMRTCCCCSCVCCCVCCCCCVCGDVKTADGSGLPYRERRPLRMAWIPGELLPHERLAYECSVSSMGSASGDGDGDRSCALPSRAAADVAAAARGWGLACAGVIAGESDASAAPRPRRPVGSIISTLIERSSGGASVSPSEPAPLWSTLTLVSTPNFVSTRKCVSAPSPSSPAPVAAAAAVQGGESRDASKPAAALLPSRPAAACRSIAGRRTVMSVLTRHGGVGLGDSRTRGLPAYAAHPRRRSATASPPEQAAWSLAARGRGRCRRRCQQQQLQRRRNACAAPQPPTTERLTRTPWAAAGRRRMPPTRLLRAPLPVRVAAARSEQTGASQRSSAMSWQSRRRTRLHRTRRRRRRRRRRQGRRRCTRPRCRCAILAPALAAG
eukprot:167687-Chlamydomonas_euryale.AAC.3